ncbi:MAG: hypothetical protein N3A67_01850 [Ignavibacteria bacterium]|nr:hypothetical protein [Ignavibacteria bacterium]
MRIKKFTAENIKEGKSLVIRELGEDAVILSSRTMINPATGSEYIEIVAAIDDINKHSKATKIADTPKQENLPQEKTELLGEAIFLKEISEIKNTLAIINSNLKYKYSGSLSPVFSKLYKRLILNEFPENYALEIVGKVSNININVEYSPAINYAKEIFAEKIKILKPLNVMTEKTVAMFIGNTGCGKTTSLVKIAVIVKLLTNKNILIVSADTYKIGGAEQLQTMSAIVGIPFKAAYSPDELRDIVQKAKTDYDLILIDTIGRNHNSEENISELADYFEMAEPNLTYLVINSTLSNATTRKILDKYSKFRLSGVILSKIDECETIGGIIPVIAEAGLPIAYVTKGQRIPDDIEPADRYKIAELMLNIEE